MKRFRTTLLAAATLALASQAAFGQDAATPPAKRNVILFVADGLRYDSVTPETAPTFWALKEKGVDFTNSHAVYPSITTVNASAIATGHLPGDTGNYANALYTGTPISCPSPRSIVFLEDDCVLAQIKAYFKAGYMGQTTLVEAARHAGYNTAILGKKGPAAIQWLAALKSEDDTVSNPLGVFIDDSTNHPKDSSGTPTGSTVLHGDLASEAVAATGAPAPASTPNLTQQGWMTSMATQALIPDFRNSGKPFVMVFWSRDPDATQHGATDSSGQIVPGINSPDGREAIYNADRDLHALLSALQLWGLDKTTDVFVTADHGFSTIGLGIPTAEGTLARSTLARGFVALDVAKWLGGQKLFDPANGNLEIAVADGQRPADGSAFIGPDANHPQAIVVANGGSDFIYVMGADKAATAKQIYSKLSEQPYVGGLFVADALLEADKAAFAGALPMGAIGLNGAGGLPRPDIVISFRSFIAKGCDLPKLLCAVEIADTGLGTGQGMHGTFSRADTRNFMAAMGPDFKAGYKDEAPVGNIDIAPTLAHLLKVQLAGPGHLAGRVIGEALKDGQPVTATHGHLAATPGANGLATVLDYQEVGQTRYFDAAGIPGRTIGLDTPK